MFNFESHNVRTVVDDSGTIWFVAKDVAVALGYARPNDAISDHCKGAVNRRPLQTAGGIQDVRIINEPDVYALIFGSKLESAEKFKLWVFNEVLPTIRKTGKYEAPKVEQKQDGGLLDDMNTIDWLIKNSNTALNTWRTSYGQFVKN